MGWGEPREPSAQEMSEVLDEVRKILKEEDKPIVNIPRLLTRLQTVTNYKGA